ncbi:hypothetical protein OG905_26115 [Streptomyces sp. NBC_00322]|nr:hypothetical protein [Streptomyces sp. NBC_00322]
MKRRSAGAVSSLVPALALVVALIAGCQQASGRTGAAASSVESGSPTPPGYGLVFLGPGDCASRGRDFREVPCTSEKASARVTARYEVRPTTGPACPAATDFVLHISASRPSTDEDGDGEVGQGYACMRNLEPPHPGDPGGGGGPHTAVGDCVYSASAGQVKETACDGSGTRAPEFRVASSVDRRAQCPPSTALYVRLEGDKPVGCARRV